MTTPDHPGARLLFERALALSPSRRASFLDEACDGEPALRAQVDALLVAHAEAGEFLARPAHVAALREQAGQMIGRYKLLQPIGEGGFGSVWMAEQREPVKRRVALKVIKLGMDTKQVIARFEAERQALALMDHPHIAKVFDAGATETGRPFFVMELVRGVPIIEYCDRERLDTRARLDLFVGVCNAIQHAHQKGIIHRDIKPSNVLVTLHDGQPVPKVIDFGIAKAVNAELTERTLFTEHRQMMGTPAYMSPEQAEMSGLDIDTRADVYSLGVLLYELLTGTTPFDMRALMQQGLAAVLRVIREVEPHKPSTRVATLGETGTRTADRRQSDVRKLGTLLRGDLDWIVMRCLEKDRTRRYETANGLALDVRRHLDGEPVTAAPPGKVYRLRKLVARNKGPMAAAALVALALILGVTGTTIGLVRAKEQWTRAESAHAQEKAERTAAEKARARAETINQFVQRTLVSSDPNQGGRQGMLVADAMMQAVAAIDAGAFAEDPETEAGLRVTTATILQGNGRAAEAEMQLRQALKIYERLHPDDNPATALAMCELAIALESLGRMAEAERLAEKALEMRLRLFPADHTAVAISLNDLAFVRFSLGLVEDADRLYLQALEMSQRLFEGDDRTVAAYLTNVASTRMALGRDAEAESLYVQALEMNKRLYKVDHPELAASLGNLASVRAARGRTAEAEPLHTEALEMTQRLFRGDHPDVAVNLSGLASLRESLGRTAEAEPLFLQALEMYQRLFDGDHPAVAQSLAKLASARESLGRPAEAEPLFVQALEMYQRLFEGDHASTAQTLASLAHTMQSSGRAAEAETIHVQALEMYERLFEGDHRDKAAALNNLALVRVSLGRAAEAEPLSAQSLEMLQRLYPGDHPFVAGALGSLAHLRLDLGRTADAEPLFAQALEMYERIHATDHPDVASASIKLGYVRMELGRTEEGEALNARALEMCRRMYAGDHVDVAVALSNIARARLLLGHPDQAEPLYRESLAVRRRLSPRDTTQSAGTMSGLARSLAEMGQSEEALQLAQEAADLTAGQLPEGHRTRERCAQALAEIRARIATRPAAVPRDG